MKRTIPIIAVLVLLVLGGGCTQQPASDPVADLKSGLDSYLEIATNEPCDDKENMARMYESVQLIKENKLYAGIDVLLDVCLYYDATDNEVAGLAEETLQSFGRRSIPAIESRILKLTGSRFEDRIPWLSKLKEYIQKQ